MSETCWAHKKWNRIASDIKLVVYSSNYYNDARSNKRKMSSSPLTVTEFYVYWTVHHLDSWIKIDQLDVICIIFHYLLLNMFRMLVHPSSGACYLFVELFHVLYCSGSMCVGVTVWFGWGGVVFVCRLTASKPTCSDAVCQIHITSALLYRWQLNHRSYGSRAAVLNVRIVKYRCQWPWWQRITLA